MAHILRSYNGSAHKGAKDLERYLGGEGATCLLIKDSSLVKELAFFYNGHGIYIRESPKDNNSLTVGIAGVDGLRVKQILAELEKEVLEN
ncbi:MAG: hypothetical protein KKF68_00420 [Nanoarchaeota archaeon]|nr:hypothetical protein [Nanoarchaeota archaeon]